jgi:hypothetical protein
VAIEVVAEPAVADDVVHGPEAVVSTAEAGVEERMVSVAVAPRRAQFEHPIALDSGRHLGPRGVRLSALGEHDPDRLTRSAGQIAVPADALIGQLGVGGSRFRRVGTPWRVEVGTSHAVGEVAFEVRPSGGPLRRTPRGRPGGCLLEHGLLRSSVVGTTKDRFDRRSVTAATCHSPDCCLV